MWSRCPCLCSGVTVGFLRSCNKRPSEENLAAECERPVDFVSTGRLISMLPLKNMIPLALPFGSARGVMLGKEEIVYWSAMFEYPVALLRG